MLQNAISCVVVLGPFMVASFERQIIFQFKTKG